MLWSINSASLEAKRPEVWLPGCSVLCSVFG